MNNQRNLYIEILKWSFDKGVDGFMWEELVSNFNLDPIKSAWVNKIFLTTNDGDRKFFEHYKYNEQDNKHIYALNEKGISAYIDYQKLEEARDSSKQAQWYAIIAIIISVAVGVYQIVVSQNVRVENPIEISNEILKTEVINQPETQDVKLQNSVIKTEITNWPK